MDGNADYENHGGMGCGLDIIHEEMERIETAADTRGWNSHNLAKLDDLIFKAKKYKLKMETLQVVDTGLQIEAYDDGYGGYGDY